MAVKKSLNHRVRRRLRHAVIGGVTRLSKRKHPQTSPAVPVTADKREDGIIRPQTSNLHLPAGLVDSGAGVSDERINLVVVVVVILSLLFIGIVTWAIARA